MCVCVCVCVCVCISVKTSSYQFDNFDLVIKSRLACGELT